MLCALSRTHFCWVLWPLQTVSLKTLVWTFQCICQGNKYVRISAQKDNNPYLTAVKSCKHLLFFASLTTPKVNKIHYSTHHLACTSQVSLSLALITLLLTYSWTLRFLYTSKSPAKHPELALRTDITVRKKCYMHVAKRPWSWQVLD